MLATLPKNVVLQLIAANYTGGRKAPPVSKSGDFAPTLTFREWVFDSGGRSPEEVRRSP